MKKSKKMIVVAIIPARGGSKGIPHKNIVRTAGKPLIAWTIEAALASHAITETYVTSDDEAILTTAQHFGAQIIRRPAVLSGDSVGYEPVLAHAVRHVVQQGIVPDIIAYLQPTSPLRNAHDVDKATKLLLYSNFQSVVSVSEIDNIFLKSFIIDRHGRLGSIGRLQYPFMRRQDLPRTAKANGALYLIRYPAWKRYHSLWTPRTGAYVMESDRSVDIDVPADVRRASRFLKRTIHHE